MSLLADRYRLGRTLGSGGMAEVVAGHDQLLGRDVAIKLIRPSLLADPTARERLLREARAAAALHHPHTVAVHNVGTDGDRPFIVMELVDGGSLADRLRDDGPLDPEELLAIGLSVLDALEAAHAAGLVHRDVKPSNILFTRDGTVKLADFGIAKALTTTDPDLTATGQVLGTPRYLAPEVAAGQPATPASDLYALGAVLYQCLAGTPPFTGSTPLSVIVAHQRQPVRPLRDLVDDVPSELARVIERALAKDPAERFVDAGHMRAALLGDDPRTEALPLPADDAGGAGLAGAGWRPAGADEPTGALEDAASGDATAAFESTGTRTGVATALVPTHVLDQPAAAAPTDGPGADLPSDEPPVDDTPAGDDSVAAGMPRWQQVVGAGLAVLLVVGLVVGVVSALGGGRGDVGPVAEEPVGTDDAANDPAGDTADTAADDEPPPPSDDAAGDTGDADDAPPADDPDTPDQTAGDEPPVEPTAPTIDDLIEQLALDPDAAGRHGDRLLAGLREVRSADPDDQATDGRELMAEIASWLARDHLERDTGATALVALEELSRPADERLAEASALFAEVAFERDAWGTKAEDLLEDLASLLASDDPDDWRDDAADLLEDVDEWLDEGQLDASRGARARETLSRLV